MVYDCWRTRVFELKRCFFLDLSMVDRRLNTMVCESLHLKAPRLHLKAPRFDLQRRFDSGCPGRDRLVHAERKTITKTKAPALVYTETTTDREREAGDPTPHMRARACTYTHREKQRRQHRYIQKQQQRYIPHTDMIHRMMLNFWNLKV
jgi:hypothetical protein